MLLLNAEPGLLKLNFQKGRFTTALYSCPDKGFAAVPADHVNGLGATDNRAAAGADPFLTVSFLCCIVARISAPGLAASGEGK